MTGKPIGVLGIGHLSCHVVPGLLRESDAPTVLLSPRNAENSARLSHQFGLEIASDNADLVERCSTILLGVRPFNALEAVRGLPWRNDHTVVSLCAGLPIKQLEAEVGRARVVRAMPVVGALYGASPTCIYPADEETRVLFERCGSVITLDDEKQFEIATVMACYSSSLMILIEQMAEWNAKAGLDAADARQLAARMTRAAADVASGRTDVSMESLVAELALPGSVTEAGMDYLRRAEAFTAWAEANDHVFSLATR
jgi:pyrroline-5-carboxylate reductase